MGFAFYFMQEIINDNKINKNKNNKNKINKKIKFIFCPISWRPGQSDLLLKILHSLYRRKWTFRLFVT